MDKLAEWIALLDGPGWQSEEARNNAVAAMRTAGRERLFSLLSAMLSDPDVEVRCQACTAILFVDDKEGLQLVLPLLEDRDRLVRWHVCGLMHDFADERAVAPLIARMQNDPDAQVRSQAAYALGGIASVQTIPALIESLDNDHELDVLGYSPSFCAAGALHDILGTEGTRIKVSESIRKMKSGEPDLASLKERAMSLHRSFLEDDGASTD